MISCYTGLLMRMGILDNIALHWIHQIDCKCSSVKPFLAHRVFCSFVVFLMAEGWICPRPNSGNPIQAPGNLHRASSLASSKLLLLPLS